MRLSLCMVVRDEADLVEDAVRSVATLADEIVVVDTGSADETVDRVQRLGARVLRVPWRDDFSAARNAALEAARGEWILVLDADERLDPRGRERLARLLDGPPRAYAFEQRNYVRRTDVNGWRPVVAGAFVPADARGYVVARQTRLFPRQAQIRYEGAVHEEVTASLERARIERHEVDVVVHHLGRMRDRERARAKAELYQRLGRRKCRRSDPGGQAALELGIQSIEAGRSDEAEEALRRALEGRDVTVRRRAADALARLLGRARRFEEGLAIVRSARADHPDDPGLLAVEASVLLESGATTEACALLHRHPASTTMLIRLRATAALRGGDLDRARASYRRLVSVAESADLGRVGLATCAAVGGDLGPVRELLADRPELRAPLLAAVARYAGVEAESGLVAVRGPERP